MIEPGTVLQQRYRIEKQIGQGGMGAVYVATDVRFNSMVAIKETLYMDDNFRKAIEREARLLNSLKHSALPRVSDHFEEENSQFLVMEYIPGEDIATRLETDHASFTVDQVLKWADQLLDALDYLHNQDMPVIHRDIKPQNLKLNSRGEIILLDFGLAKGNPTDAGHQTAAKSIFGYSRNYASLEQIQGTGTDPRSDLYSLAATLYHLLTRVAPEDALTRAMSVLSQKGDPLTPANALNPAIPRGVAGVLHKALDLNASERPSTAAEMREMLREHEKYGYLADPVTVQTHVPDPKLFAEPTRLMADKTNAAGNNTDVKTEVLQDHQSKETSMRIGVPAGTNVVPSGDTEAGAPKRRAFAAVAAVLAFLLAGGAIAGGLYVAKPSLFGVESAPAPPVAPVEAKTEPAAQEPTTSANTIGQPANVAETSGTVTETIKPAEKTSESAKNSKTPSADKQKAASENTLDVTMDDPDIPPEGIVVTQTDQNGNPRTIRVMPGKRPGVRVPEPGFDPFPPNYEFRGMTPEQRRKLQQMLKNNERIIRERQQRMPVPPTPRPTP